MTKKHLFSFSYLFLFFSTVCVFFPQSSPGFSETDIDSLESTGKKSFSSRPWRTQFSVTLQRNLLLNSHYSDNTGRDIRKLFDTDEEASFLDFSNLYYTLSLNLNYSLGETIKHLGYDFLKNTELFLNNSFQSPVTGYNNILEGYGPVDYIHYALGDIAIGFTTPVYKKEDFFSELSFSLVPYRLSRFSKEAGLLTAANGTISFLYFFKKRSKWSLALSSSHSLAYYHYTKEAADKDGIVYNIPKETRQTGSFIFKQNFNKYMPANIQISSTHFFGIDKLSTRIHDLTFSSAFSWKIKNRVYMNFSIRWKDRIDFYHPDNKQVRKKEPTRWFNWDKYVFSIGGSYSF